MGEALEPLQVINEQARATFALSRHLWRDQSKKGVDRFSGSGIPEWARWLIAAEVTQMKPSENSGTKTVRRLEITGSSIPEARFVVTRTMGAFDPTDADSRLWMETSVSESPQDDERVAGGVKLGPA